MLRRRFFLALVAVATCVSCAAVWNPTLVGVELPRGVDLRPPPTYLLPENPAGPQPAPAIEPSQNEGKGEKSWPRDFHLDEWVV